MMWRVVLMEEDSRSAEGYPEPIPMICFRPACHKGLCNDATVWLRPPTI